MSKYDENSSEATDPRNSMNSKHKKHIENFTVVLHNCLNTHKEKNILKTFKNSINTETKNKKLSADSMSETIQ